MTKARELSELGDKIAVDGSGVDVTGTVTADGLTVGNGTQQIRTYVDADEVSQLIDGNVRYDIWTGGDKTMRLDANGDISFYEDTGATPKFFWDASAERLGIGTTSPALPLTVDGGDIGTDGNYRIKDSGGTYRPILSMISDDTVIQTGTTSGTRSILFYTEGLERVRIDSSGNLLVGKTSAAYNTNGFETGSGGTYVSRNGLALGVNRNASNGPLVNFYKDGSTAGSIEVDPSHIGIGSAATGLYFYDSVDAIIPSGNSGSFLNGRDNAIDLGNAAARFQDIYATNGTIQTSDRNEKQDIEALSDAEQRVAVAAKGLLRKYRWKDAVAEKGDAARIHFGIIAQDLQAAFEAEGLDAGRYGMFISSTWWEADRVIPAVEAVEAQDAVYETVVVPAVLDEDGNEIEPERTEQVLVSEAVEAVEAQPERTVTDTYQTQEEAPEGAVERTRMGVRYPELLAFIIAAI